MHQRFRILGSRVGNILNLWCMLFYIVVVKLIVFALSFKILRANCVRIFFEFFLIFYITLKICVPTILKCPTYGQKNLLHKKKFVLKNGVPTYLCLNFLIRYIRYWWSTIYCQKSGFVDHPHSYFRIRWVHDDRNRLCRLLLQQGRWWNRISVK